MSTIAQSFDGHRLAPKNTPDQPFPVAVTVKTEFTPISVIIKGEIIGANLTFKGATSPTPRSTGTSMPQIEGGSFPVPGGT